MPKTSAPKQTGTSAINGVPVNLYELKAKTKDSADKVTEFTYEFPKFSPETTLDQIATALTYQNSKKETISGADVIRDYVNTAIKNEKRSSKLAEINGVLKLREDPEKAINDMIEQMVVGFGVAREIATANVRAMMAQGSVAKEKENATA